MMHFNHYGFLNRWTCCCTWTVPGFYDMFAMDASQMDLLLQMDIVECFVSLPWMPQQMDLLLHMDIAIIYACLLWMPQQKDLLLHMDTVVMLYVPDFLWSQKSKTIN